MQKGKIVGKDDVELLGSAFWTDSILWINNTQKTWGFKISYPPQMWFQSQQTCETSFTLGILLIFF